MGFQSFDYITNYYSFYLDTLFCLFDLNSLVKQIATIVSRVGHDKGLKATHVQDLVWDWDCHLTTCKELNPPVNHMNLDINSSPVEPSDKFPDPEVASDFSLIIGRKQSTHTGQTQISDSQELWDDKCTLFLNYYVLLWCVLWYKCKLLVPNTQ